MPTPDLTRPGKQVVTGRDTAVIKSYQDGYEGGRSLDVTGFAPTVIRCGHVIIRATTGAKAFKPMPVNGGATAYASLPADHEYVGILVSTVETSLAFAAIMTQGTVNPNALHIPITPILTAFKTAMNQIEFRAD